MPEIELRNITKRFGKKILAVNNVSLSIHDKEYFSLVGPSGCGKTTLLRMIAGLIQPDEGEIYINGKLVNNVPPEDRGIGFVFQTYALFPHMDVFDNVTYGPRVKAWDKDKAARLAREILEMVRLNQRVDAYPRELSGGMMQRVGVARALAAGGQILLLDEPLGALDAKIRFELRYDIRRLVKDLELTAVHVTHDQAEAMAVSDRIAVMKEGRVIQVGTPPELYMHPNDVFVAHFIGESNFLEGRVSKSLDDRVLLNLRGGLEVEAQKDGVFREDDRVVLAVRPQALEVANGWRKIGNGLRGIVERVRFEGTDVRYEVKLVNDEVVTVVRPSLGGEELKEGDKVTVSFQPEKSHVFLYPLKGLTSALRSE